MGYFWDPLDRQWLPRPRWQRRLCEKRQANRRRRLLQQLVAEIDDKPIPPPERFEGDDDTKYFAVTQQNDRAAKLFAALLARSLIGTDEMLMKEWGQEIAELTAGGEKVCK